MTKRVPFTKEFEQEAVRLAETSGRTWKEILRQEREILKRATAFFAREGGR